MTYRITAGPATEPLSLAYVKNHLRVDDSQDDTLILGLMATARRWAEMQTGRALITQTIEQVWDCWPCGRALELGFGPVSEIISVQYTDADGAYLDWDADNYTLDEISLPGRLVRKPNVAWPTTSEYPNAVRVTYVAGNSAAADVPDGIKQAILLLIGYLYDNREDSTLSNSNDPAIRSAGWLLGQFKTVLI